MTTDHDLILTLSRAVDAVRETNESTLDPQHWWVPLEAVLPADECAGFMFMGAVECAIVPESRSFIGPAEAHNPNPAWERRVIWRYKHGITRKYLNLSDNLRPYYYVGSTLDYTLNTYAHVAGGERALERAIDIAFDGIEQFGASRSTAYNAEYISARNARLVAAGFTVIG